MSECLDLVDGLPDGSAYVRATCPERRWSESRVLTTEIKDLLIKIGLALGIPDDRRQVIERPWDELLQRLREEEGARRAKEAMQAGEYIRSIKWEAV